MSATSKIEAVIRTRYGIEPHEADAIVVEWSAEYLATQEGPVVAAKAWKALNAKRYKLGRYTSIPNRHSALYAPYFAKAVTS